MAKKDMEVEMEAMPVDNVGIMQGFLEMMNEDDDEFEEDDEYEAGEMLGRTPDSPEILMNNLRGDMRSIDARRDELADMVGYAAAAETPEPVLAMLQPVLAQQGIGAMMPPGPMPPGGISPVGAPNMPNVPNVPNVPNMPSDMMTPMQPMPAGGIGDMAPGAMPPGPPPLQMARGGVVQRFSEGTLAPDAIQDGGASVPPSREEVQKATNFLAAREKLLSQPRAAFDLPGAMTKQEDLFRKAMGGEKSGDMAKVMMLTDLANRAFGYAANVDEQGRPLRGSAISRLAQAARTLPQTTAQFIADKNKQDQAIKLAALQSAQKLEERDIATRQAQEKQLFDYYKTVLDRDTKTEKFRFLSEDERRKIEAESGMQLPTGQGQVYQVGERSNKLVVLGKPEVSLQLPSNKAETAAATEAGKASSQDLIETFKIAQKGEKAIVKLNKAMERLNQMEVPTGPVTPFIKSFNSLRAQLLNDRAAGKIATDIEMVDALLGSGVFSAIQDLGIGARGLDTPAEKQFLLQVLTGSTGMTLDSLKELTQLRQQIAADAINKYNSWSDAGILKDFKRDYVPAQAVNRFKAPAIVQPRYGNRGPNDPRTDREVQQLFGPN
jgi:hypothetical protein